MKTIVQAIIKCFAIYMIMSGVQFLMFLRYIRWIRADLINKPTLDTWLLEVAFALMLPGILWIYSAELSKWILAQRTRHYIIGARLATVCIATVYAPYAFTLIAAQLSGRTLSSIEKSQDIFLWQSETLRTISLSLSVVLPIFMLCIISVVDYLKTIDDPVLD